jgi:hypothetical protein
MYHLTSDPQNNIIVYLDEDHYANIIIENFKSKKRQVVEMPQKCSSVFIGYCIDSISVNKNELYYRLAYPHNFDEKKKLTEYRVKIKL